MDKQLFPEPTVGALIFNKQGKILLMKSHKWRNQYVVPGGHIEIGETARNALKREILEETGLRIYGIRFVMLQEFVLDNAFWKKRHFLFLDFACRTRSTKIRLNSEAQEYVWVPVPTTLRMRVEPYTRNAIAAYMRMKKSGSASIRL